MITHIKNHSSYYIFSILTLSIILSDFSYSMYIDFSVTAMLLIMMIAWGTSIALKCGHLRMYTFSMLMIAYFFQLFITSQFSTVPFASSAVLSKLTALPFVYLFATNYRGFSNSWAIIKVALYVLTALFSCMAISQVYEHVAYGHATGPFADRNAFAAFLNLSIFSIVASLFLSDYKRNYINKCKYLLTAIVFFIVSIALFATLSRGAILIWIVLMPLMLWAGYRYEKSLPKLILIISLSVAAFVISVNILGNNFFVERDFNLKQDGSTNARLQIWMSTLNMVMDNPWLGTGLGTFQYYYPRYRSLLERGSSGQFSHNDYLQLAAESGVFSMLILLILYAFVIFKVKKIIVKNDANNFESLGLLFGVLAIFTHALVNFIFYYAALNVIVGLYLARASILTESLRTLPLPKLNIRLSIKKVIFSLVIAISLAPFATHFLTQVCFSGSQTGLKLLKVVSPKINVFNLANFITALYPSGVASQEYLLRVYEYSLINNKAFSKKSEKNKVMLLKDAVEGFDRIRSQTAFNPSYGMREVKLIFTNRKLYDKTILSEKETATQKIYRVLSRNLEADPSHCQSYIMLSRLQMLDDQKIQASNTLKLAKSKVFTVRDYMLIRLEEIKQHKNAQFLDDLTVKELARVEEELLAVKSPSESRSAYIWDQQFYESMDAVIIRAAQKLVNHNVSASQRLEKSL